MPFKPLSGANTVSECLKDIDKRVNGWYERVAKIYYWLVDVVKYYKVVDLLDILFLGVVNTCTVYRCCDCEFSHVFCDDVFIEIHELCHYVPGRYAFHTAPEVIKTLWDISNSAYKVAKETSLGRVERIWKNRLHVPLGYFEIPYSARTSVLIDMYYPKRQVLSSARKLDLRASDISMEANIVSKRLNVKLGNCEIKYEEDTGLSASKECPNTPELCDVMEAIFGIVDSSVNIFEKISREGVRVVTTYLLY
jgi:hypothetical protein